MDSHPKLSGETLIVHHIPLVHCQVSGGRQCCGSLKRGNPFSPPENLGLSRTTSLPERDVLQHEPLVYSSLIQTSGSSLSSSDTGPGEGGKDWRQEGGGGQGGEGRAGGGGEGSGGSMTSDASFTSSNSEDPPTIRYEGSGFKHRDRGNHLRHNPFLLNREEEEEEEDDDGDNLNGYLEDSSFHLHGSTNDALNNETGVSSFHLHEVDYHPEPFLLHGNQGKPWYSSGGPRRLTQSSDGCQGGSIELTSGLDSLGLRRLGSQRRHGSSGSTLSMDCGEHEWGEDDEDEEEEDEDQPMRSGRGSQGGSSSGCSSAQRCSCCSLCQPYPEPFTEAFPDCPLGYGSDSSCNSSDGVLVNFSTIYNKMNNVVPATKAHPNLNSSTEQSCTSSVPEPPGGICVRAECTRGSGAFYLDLHTSPTDPPEAAHVGSAPAPLDPAKSTSSCSCLTLSQQQDTMELDANCNSYNHLHHHGGEDAQSAEAFAGDGTTQHQSEARLVVAATQNYYKLVNCDLSSQSSPSPAGSSITSCSDEHSKGSPTQPSEYYLFRRHEEEDGEEDGEEEGEDEFSLSQGESEEKKQQKLGTSASDQNIIEGQVHVNISPPLGHLAGGAQGRPRSRSYDRNLDKSPTSRLGSLERMLSCPVRLSEGAALSPAPPPRVTSFAEIARNKRRTVPCLRTGTEASTAHSTHSQSSGEFSPILGQSHSLPPLTHCCSQGTSPPGHRGGTLRESPGAAGREPRTKAEGGLSSSTDGSPVVMRYSKDQRPTTLPIQPFTFQHQFQKSQKPLLPLISGYVSHMHARGAAAPPEGGEDEPREERKHPRYQPLAEAPTSVRPSPLGSYSPVRLQGAPSVSSCSTCSPSPEPGGAAVGRSRPPRSLSCPISASLLPTTLSHSPPGGAADTHAKLTPLPTTPPPPPVAKKSPVPAGSLHDRPGVCLHRTNLPPLPALPSLPNSGIGTLESLERNQHEGVKNIMPGFGAARPANAHHLSPQALKWREYRRQNPLGLERGPSGTPAPLAGSLDTRRGCGGGGRLTRRNVFDFPPAAHTLSRLNAHSMRHFQQCYSDFLPDYFSQTERPPEEFCLSPDASSDESSISIDLLQKRGLVKAVNTAVDLIVAHFGTSRDPGVKAKLGNSSVSPNVGHLILKYLCPAIREILQDGLRSYMLDLIIGQCRNQPWSVVEASTQLGPSTRLLHILFTKVSQYSELTSHSMRLNAFIFGLLNLRSLEFWLDHIYTHEDVVAAHYHPWGFLPLSQGMCQSLFEELLLLLQPLSLLPFDLDLLFEPHLLQKGQEHLRRKEQLCSSGQGLDQSARSTFQLMQGRGVTGPEPISEEEAGTEAGHPREGLRPRTRGGAPKRCSSEPRRLGAASQEPAAAKPAANDDMDLWRCREASRRGGARHGERVKGVGGEWPGADPSSQAAAVALVGATDGSRQKSRQAGWWYQLMQSSQVYIDNSTEGSKFVKWEKRKKSSGDGRRQSHPPPREGVVEGAEANQGPEEGRRKGNRSSSSSSNSNSSGSSSQSTCTSTASSRATKAKSTWMGTPPESVLFELKKSQQEEPEVPQAPAAPPAGAAEESPAQGMRWGRLFGAGATTRTERAEQRATRCPKNRLPSGWLSLVAQTVGTARQADAPADRPSASHGEKRSATQQAQAQAPSVEQKASCEVRALCHHVASEPGHLSFCKGDVMQVLSRADSDWLVCSLGETRGLVPIIYVTLRDESQSQGPQLTH
ncbi:iporin isoform X1 [Clupea harengus]|uniref:Iporin isoform X1 n=1 Tax=Clupea harengus TaxID=7950 RepID=A0A6P8FRG8_CLUHA|nr:iporin isoform X1 [Clupea harengus]